MSEKVLINEHDLSACQVEGLANISTGEIKVASKTLRGRVALFLHRNFNPKQKRVLKKYSNRLLDALGRGQKLKEISPPIISSHIQTGDLVRVKSEEEILATLDHWHALKGCGFMKEMKPYCGTTQRVHKSVKRFLDERDYRVKKVSSIVLLENVYCQGTEKFGPCDRSCFFFWREEWLEKVE